MDNELLLLSGEDIPFIEAQINIHQPKLYEISLIGEENFFAGCQLLNFSKDQLSDKDKSVLENKSDFEIFMSIMCSQERMEYKNSVMMLLALLFPDYQIKFTRNEILLASEQNTTRINKENYDIFKNIINFMFGLNESDLVGSEYNPIDKRAEKIAKKLKERREKIAQKNGEQPKIAIFSRYISILSVGLKMDINILKQYTVFQLKDSFTRYQKKDDFDTYLKARLAGAQDLDEVDNWMIDIHSQSKKLQFLKEE